MSTWAAERDAQGTQRAWVTYRAGKAVTIACTPEGWISVDAELPPYGVRVQVVDPRHRIVYYDTRWIDRKGGHWTIEQDVKLWQPQPALPVIRIEELML